LQKRRQTGPLTAADYELLDEDFRRTLEVADGIPGRLDAVRPHPAGSSATLR
jgi:hypothetical protein